MDFVPHEKTLCNFKGLRGEKNCLIIVKLGGLITSTVN